MLVVDDDPRLRAGFNVSEAGDGRAALVAIRLNQPALVVLDVVMPELDGIAMCRELRATWNIPVIFLSSRAEEADRVLGLDLGGDDYERVARSAIALLPITGNAGFAKLEPSVAFPVVVLVIVVVIDSRGRWLVGSCGGGRGQPSGACARRARSPVAAYVAASALR